MDRNSEKIVVLVAIMSIALSFVALFLGIGAMIEVAFFAISTAGMISTIVIIATYAFKGE